MGFLDSLFAVSLGVRPLLSSIPVVASWVLPAPSSKTIQHDVSFDLTTPHPSRKTLKRALPPPKPVPLPLELVLSIIELACYDNATADESLLKQCALVCRAWSAPAQRLLFSNVTLRTKPACDAFSGAIDRSTEHGRMLGDAVTRLRVVVDNNQPLGISQHVFAKTVAACPNLYELNLSLHGCGAPGQDFIGTPDMARLCCEVPSFDDETLALLRDGPKITALEFNNWTENQASVTQLLDVWPSLRALSMSGTPPQPPSPLLVPFACSLEQVRMNFQKTPSADFVNWLLHNSMDSLRILELDREPSIHLLQHLTSTHGASLHSLSLPLCSTSEQVLAVQRCEELKELRVEHPVTSPQLFKAIPQGVHHIALGLSRSSHLQALVETVRSSKSLTDLSVVLYDGGDQHPLLPVLKMACASQGVELRIMRDIQLFRSVMVRLVTFLFLTLF